MSVSRKPKRRKKKRGDLHNIVINIGKGYKPRIMTLMNMLQMIDEVGYKCSSVVRRARVTGGCLVVC